MATKSDVGKNELKEFYQQLKRLEKCTVRRRRFGDAMKEKTQWWPDGGVYFFINTKLKSVISGFPRIIRVGTHGIKKASLDTILFDRLQAHYSGNCRGSSFRKYVYDVLVKSKKLKNAAPKEVKQAVSDYIGSLGVVLLSVPNHDDRKFIESNAIAFLSDLQPESNAIDDDPVLKASKNKKINKSQLWDNQHVGGRYCSEELLKKLTYYVDKSIKEYATWKNR
jgi:hypothetical protein